MKERKVVLVSKSGYSAKHDPLLEKLLEKNIELFCVWGKDCELWEEIMDELAVGDATNIREMITTSHPKETLEEVLKFAEEWKTEKPSSVRVIEI